MSEQRVVALRRLGAAVATGIAAWLVLRLPLGLLSIPGWPTGDGHQARLTEWSDRLSAVLARVPPEAVLGFVPQRELPDPFGTIAPFEPVTGLDAVTREEFERIKAVIAPRRILPDVEADFVLAHGGALVRLSKIPGFESLGELEPVLPGWYLAERKGR